MTTGEGGRAVSQEAISPLQHATKATNAPLDQALRSLGNIDDALNNLDLRADPDAQATVTDFLDFTEYLPADMMRSLTLIGKLDKTYTGASVKVHELTVNWGSLPNMALEERISPTQLRALISENLSRAVSSRVYSHAEAVRMSENIIRHHKRAKTILAKLHVMLENYPAAEKEIAANKSPQVTRNTKFALRDNTRLSRQRIPRITVPGEVLAPYDPNYDAISSEADGDSSAEDETDKPVNARRITPGPQPRIKVVKGSVAGKPLKTPKVLKPKTLGPPPPPPPGGLSTGAALSKLKPPPENAEIGGPDAPWCQLTLWELAVLRKRMKKNANWVPSETMVARELLEKKRSIEHYTAAKQKAEDAGTPFEGKLPEPVPWGDGVKRLPPGALNPHNRIPDEKFVANRGIALNELKRQKKLLEKLNTDDAKNSESRFSQLVKEAMNPLQAVVSQLPPAVIPLCSKPPKRKRPQSLPRSEEQKPDVVDPQEVPRPLLKRPKTETPVPPPLLNTNPSPIPAKHTQRSALSANTPQTTTPIPVPIPVHGQEVSFTAKSTRSAASAASPASNGEVASLDKPSTKFIPAKQPTETPIPPPLQPSKKPTIPIEPPLRETRKSQARKQEQQKENQAALSNMEAYHAGSPEPLTVKPDPDAQPTGSSEATASAVSGSTTVARRPASRGQASSNEPHLSLAADRPRRASTARNTPAPEPIQRPVGKRPKRPVPGVITRTHSGGSSAIGRRKAAPKKGRRKPGKEKSASGTNVDAVGGGLEVEVEVDDEGNVIDPDEARYCMCNRVSFGTMIQCDNVDNCKYEWFHLECVGLTEILPARTTKWYCPDCRVLLKLGERGEVSARGVKA